MLTNHTIQNMLTHYRLISEKTIYYVNYFVNTVTERGQSYVLSMRNVMNNFALTHRGRVTHVCACKRSDHWFP